MLKALKFVSAAIVIAAGSASAACAGQIYDQRAPYYRNIDQRAYDIGFREGNRQGENDGRRGRDYSLNRHDEFRDADDGYHRGDGDREFYRRSYRQGFETGYNQGFNRFVNSGRYPRSTYPTYPTYPTSPSYPSYPERGVPRGTVYSPASQNGYRDGFDEGRNDARDRRAFDPQRTKRYRDGDHDFNGRYGSRDDYRREYRVGFEQGYREGFEESRRF